MFFEKMLHTLYSLSLLNHWSWAVAMPRLPCMSSLQHCDEFFHFSPLYSCLFSAKIALRVRRVLPPIERRLRGIIFGSCQRVNHSSDTLRTLRAQGLHIRLNYPWE